MSKTETISNQADVTAVTDAALDYVFGVATKDKDRLEKAFDVPKAQMKLITGPEGGEKVYVIPVRDVWDKIWSTLPDAETHGVEITAISIQEGRVASVELNNNDRFFDQLGLYKINGEWKIYDKLTRMLDGGQIVEPDLIAMFGEQA